MARRRKIPEIPAHRTVPPTEERGTRWEVPSMAQKKLGLWVRAAGYMRAARPGKLNDRRLGNYAAVYVSRGRGWFDTPPTGRLQVQPGSLLWLFPEVPHNYAPFETWAEQWVIFDGPMAEAFERQGFLDPSKALVRVGGEAEVARLFGRLREVFIHGGPLAVGLASALVHQLIVVVHGLATGLSGGAGDAERADPDIAGALRIIEQEAAAGLQPAALAERLHTGYSTLRRRFKRQTGYSVKEYLLRVQLKRAKDLLAFTRWPVARIAREAGFEDPYYFARIFRKREGVAPSVFREGESRIASRDESTGGEDQDGGGGGR